MKNNILADNEQYVTFAILPSMENTEKYTGLAMFPKRYNVRIKHAK